MGEWKRVFCDARRLSTVLLTAFLSAAFFFAGRAPYFGPDFARVTILCERYYADLSAELRRTHEYEKNKGTGDYTSEAAILKYSFSSGELEVAIPKLDADGHSDFFDVTFMRNVIAGHWGGVTYLFDYSGEYVGYAEHAANAAEVAYSDGKYVYYADRSIGGGQSSDTITFNSSPVTNVR